MRRVILVIGSDLETRRMLLRSLKAMGFEAFGATNGRQGLALIGMQASKDVDGIVLDLELVEGMGVLRTLQEQHADIPVIVVSGVSTKDWTEEVLGKDERDYDYLVKPIDIRLLRDKCLQRFIPPEDNAV